MVVHQGKLFIYYMIKIGYMINANLLFTMLKLNIKDVYNDISKGFNKSYVEKYYIKEKINSMLQPRFKTLVIDVEYISPGDLLLFIKLKDDFLTCINNVKNDIQIQLNHVIQNIEGMDLKAFGNLKVIKYNKQL